MRLTLALVSLLVLSWPGAGRQHLPVARPDRRVAPAARYAVIIVLDGARPDYFHLAHMPHLAALMRSGVYYSRAFVGQLIANTPPSHATIGTGVFPRRHGIQGFWWKNPATGAATRPTDIGPVEKGALEAVLRQHHVPSLAASLKASNPRARIVAVSGHKCYAADAMGTGSADYILCSLIYHNRWVAQAVGGHVPPPGAINNPRWDVPIPNPSSGFAPAVEQWKLGEENDWTVRYALWAFGRVHYPRLLMINLPETDVTGHFTSHWGSVEGTLMAHFDDELGEIEDAYRRAGVLSQTAFVVVADHGMSRIENQLPGDLLDRAVAMAGAGKVFIEEDTAGVIGIREAAKARTVARDVALLGGNLVDATYYKTRAHGRWEYLPASIRSTLPYYLRRAYLTLADTSAAADGPDVVAVYAPHVSNAYHTAGSYQWVAGHLGPQWDDQHVPLLLAGPGVRRGAVSAYPARLVDVAPTVASLLGVSHKRMDGVVLDDALLRPSAAGKSIQKRTARALTPLVEALQARSGER